MVCSVEPETWISNNRPSGYEYEDDLEDDVDYETGDTELEDIRPEHPKSGPSKHFFIMTLIPMLCLTLLGIILVIIALIRNNRKKYLYSTGRSVMTFSNPNYYSSEPTVPSSSNIDKKSFIWKRLKYDKSQV